MDSVFDLIFDFFGQVISWLKLIPVWDNVSLYDFSIAILIMSIVIAAFVNVVGVGSTDSSISDSVDSIRFKHQTKKDIEKALQNKRDIEDERGY